MPAGAFKIPGTGVRALSRVAFASGRAAPSRAFRLTRQRDHSVRLSSTIAGRPVVVSPPLQRSFFRRFLIVSAMGVTFTTIGFMAAVAPSYQLWNGLLYPPSDAETVSLHKPSDGAAAVIEATLQNHSLVRELRARPEVTEARPHMKIPEHLRVHHLTSGLLTGPGKLVVPPIAFFEGEAQSTSVMLMYIGADVCGHPDVVHGGVLATILDEGLARCCFHALPHKIAMTAQLDIKYCKPVPADTYVVLRAKTTKVEGRKAWAEGRLESLPTKEGEETKVFVEAKGLFVEPRQAKHMASLYPSAAAG